MAISSWSVVILNWNRSNDTIECIQSLERAGLSPTQIILVDNGSTDNSLDHFSQVLNTSMIKLLSLSKNLGFAGGVNRGIHAALANGAEWILLINNDTAVDLNFFQKLEEAVTEQPMWRIIAPLILHADEPDRIWSMGDRCIRPTTLTYRLFSRQPIPRHLPKYVEVDSLNACAVLIHKDVFAKIGFFDESYFMYAEDADFCWRARRAGFQLGVATQARMWHKVARSTHPHHPQRRYWRIFNQILFYRRREHLLFLPFIFLFTLVRVVFLTIDDILQGHLAVTQSSWHGWIDGWFSMQPPSSQENCG
jgi:GT2 family glycosyltransferase